PVPIELSGIPDSSSHPQSRCLSSTIAGVFLSVDFPTVPNFLPTFAVEQGTSEYLEVFPVAPSKVQVHPTGCMDAPCLT
ncbi:MAG TPA: hypothetical protein VJS37_17075, partial [Terriglobales bacterium]|nr:hypothetical protein [Terriglobales bacterium]